MKLSLAITTYNRAEMTIKLLKSNIVFDNRVSEIVVLDDCSFEIEYNILKDFVSRECSDKVKLYRNEQNEGMSLAKKKAIELCENEWVLIFDSDNIIDSTYIDAFQNTEIPHEDIIYCPSIAWPKYNYTEYIQDINVCYGKNNVKKYLDQKNFQCLLNTCNYIVNRKRYLETYQYRSDISAADTIWHAYNHFKNNGYLVVVPDMQYGHNVWSGSGWKKDRKNSLEKFNEVIDLIRAL